MAWFSVLVFGAVVNALYLASPLFMLQVYDRVLPSGHGGTLLALFALVVFLGVVQVIVDTARGRILARLGARLQARAEALSPALGDGPPAAPAPVEGELFYRVMARGPVMALLDAPWAVLFALVLFWCHPLLGWLSVGGACFLCALVAGGHILAARAVAGGGDAAAAFHERVGRGAAAGPMDLGRHAHQAWRRWRRDLGARVLALDDGVFLVQASARHGRLLLQSASLAMGAWLVIEGSLAPGLMIAASILQGRALAPIEALVGQIDPLVQAARQARRLRAAEARAAGGGAQAALAGAALAGAALSGLGDDTREDKGAQAGGVVPDDAAACPVHDPVHDPVHGPGPAPGPLVIQGAILAPAGRPVLQIDQLRVEPGQALGVIGPAGSGKTVLAEALVGVQPLLAGRMALGGVTLPLRPGQGALLGYVAQDPLPLIGPVQAIISRYGPPLGAATVRATARALGIEGRIDALPQGFDTVLGAAPGGARDPLSGGLRQGLALARAFHGAPALIVLDEPNAHLDAALSGALNRTIRAAKRRGAVVVVLAHRPASISECDLLLMLEEGRVVALGPRDAVLKRTVRNHMALVDRQAGGV